MYLIGVLEDNIGFFIGKSGSALLGIYHNLSHDNQIDSQPIIINTIVKISSFADPIITYNLYLIFSSFVNLITAYFVFKKFHKNSTAIILSITYSFSPFIIFKSQNHPTLVATWLLNLGLFFILKNKLTFKCTIVLGIYLAFATLASNYYGYFLVLFAGVYYGVETLRFFVQKKWRAGFDIILKLTLAMFIAVTVIVITIFPYVKANYFNGKTETKIGQREVIIEGTKIEVIGTSWQIRTPNSTIAAANPLVLPRSIEDFVYFTSRPWYYLLPPTNNIFFGQISKSIIDHLQSIPSNWLAQNYFMREHSASYLGWANILLFVIGILNAYKAKKQLINPILITIAILFLITMPPFFTIAGNKIYLPSYILYLVFPMFRTLSRLGMVILPLFMIIAGYGYQYLFGLNKKYIGVTIALLLFIFSIAEFIIPLKITPADYKAELFIKLNVDLPKEAVLALYPEEDANIVVFNINRLQRPLINPKGYVAPEFGFDAQNFTDNLPTCQGILEARNLGVTHILVYGRPDKPYTEIRNQLRTSELINSNVNYSEYDAEVFEIKQTIDYQKAKTDCLTKIQNN